jgi:hypothetical protein
VVLLGTRTKALDFRPSAAEESRRIVAEALGYWGLDLDVGAVQSCTSELVTNALRHGRSPLHLVIQHWIDAVQIVVIDGAEEHEGHPDAGPYGEWSTRLRIVQGLAASWGVEHVPAGTAAWFDVAIGPASRTSSISAGATKGAAIAGAEWLVSGRALPAGRVVGGLKPPTVSDLPS